MAALPHRKTFLDGYGFSFTLLSRDVRVARGQCTAEALEEVVVMIRATPKARHQQFSGKAARS